MTTTTRRVWNLGTSTAAALTLAWAAGGCMFLIPKAGSAPPVIETQALHDAPAVAKTPVASLRVLGPQTLPVGLFFGRDASGMQMYAVPGYPTAKAHHVVIAAVASQRGARWPDPQQEKDGMLAKAAELGANAVFFPEAGGSIAYAVYVAPSAPESYSDHAALLRDEARALADQDKSWREQGKPQKRSLGRDEELAFTAEIATCYAVAFALDRGAELDDTARRYLELRLRANDALMLNKSLLLSEELTTPEGVRMQAPLNGPYVHTRSGRMELGCADGPTAVKVALLTSGERPASGTGEYYVQLYAHRITKEQLAQKRREHAEEMARAAEASRRAAEERRERELAQRERDLAQREQREKREREDRERAASSNGAGGASPGSGGSSGSTHFSFNLKNECSRTVKLAISSGGGNPKYHADLNTSIGGNTLASYSGDGQKTYWIVDDSGEGISSFTAGPGQRDMRILPSCTGFAPR